MEWPPERGSAGLLTRIFRWRGGCRQKQRAAGRKDDRPEPKKPAKKKKRVPLGLRLGLAAKVYTCKGRARMG